MPTEDSADHEFVFLVHKSNPPAPSSSVTSLSSSSSSSGSSSGSSSTTCRLPRFPHLRPIPIELQETDHDEDRGSPRAPFTSVAGSPPRSPPPISTCSSRMSPLPMELLELMPARLRMQGYISGRTAPADDPPPSRPPPPTNYPPADYCYVGVDSGSGDVLLESEETAAAVDHNYDYLRELVTSDAVAVLANNSSPITSLARSTVKARAASPSHRSSTGDVVLVGGVRPKFAKPDIITSNVASGRSHYQLPSPKFTRTSSENSTSFQQTSSTSQHHNVSGGSTQNTLRGASALQSFPETQTVSSSALTMKSTSFTSPGNSGPSSTTSAPYRAVLANDGGNNPVLRKLGEQPAPFLASFRSAGGTNVTGSSSSSPKGPVLNQSRNESPSSYTGSPSSRSYGNSPVSSRNPTPNTSNRTTPSSSHTATPVAKRAPFSNIKPGSPTPEDSKKPDDGNPPTEMLRETIVTDQSNYVVSRSHLRNRLPSPPSYRSPVPHRSDRNTSESSCTDNSAPCVPPRRAAVSDGFSSESSSSYSRSSLGGHRPTHGSSTRPAQGITKLSYPLSDKYTNVLNANMSSAKSPSNEISSVPPPMEKLRFSRPLGIYSMQSDSSNSYRSPSPGEVTVQQREAAANIQDRLFSKANHLTRQAGMSPVLHRRSPQQSPEFFQLPLSSTPPPLPGHNAAKFTTPQSYPQAGCHPVPIVESPTDSGPPLPFRSYSAGLTSGPTQSRHSPVSSAQAFNCSSGNKGPYTSPILSRVPYQGQHRFIQPLPAPPPSLPWAKGSTPPRLNSYDPDGIYDNLIVKSKSKQTDGGGHYKAPSSAPNSPLTRHMSPVPSQWSPTALRRSASPPNSEWGQSQQPYLQQQYFQHQQMQHQQQQIQHQPLPLVEQSYHHQQQPQHQHHMQHQQPSEDQLYRRCVDQQSPYHCHSQPEQPPSHPSQLHYGGGLSCQHKMPQQKPVQYWSNADPCPTCQQPPPPPFQNALYRSSSCERFAPPPRPSPSSSPQLARRGGSASPSLRHSPSPDPGGGGGLGKPPRPRRQQYRRVAYSPPQHPQVQSLLCSTPGCTIPHIHHQQASPTAPHVYHQSGSSGNLATGIHQRSPHLCYQETHLSHLSAHAPACLASSTQQRGQLPQTCHHLLSSSSSSVATAGGPGIQHVSNAAATSVSSLQQCNISEPFQCPGAGLHTFKNVSAMNTCTVLTSSEGQAADPCCRESVVAAESEAVGVGGEDLANKLKGGPGHKSLYRCVRSLLMPNQ